jgi:hypothetical protein
MHSANSNNHGIATGALVFAVVALLISLGGNLVVLDNTRANLAAARQERLLLCRNQHAIIGMQRLFLAEHAAIRVQLMDAGIPNEHADPKLLERLDVLIDAADCDPSKLNAE